MSKHFHGSYVVPLLSILALILILLSSCGESPQEKISRGHRDAIKAQCKNKSDPKLCNREVRKSFIDNGHAYATFDDLAKDQAREIKLNCAPKQEYGLITYNDCLLKWKQLALGDKLTDPEGEREPVIKSNIDKLKNYSYLVLSYDGNTNIPVGGGTGVAVDENYIATNCHVIFNDVNNKYFSPIYVYNLLNKKEGGRVRLFKKGYNKGIDICILKTKKNLEYVEKREKFKKLQQTDFVRAIGNPKHIMGHTADGNITAKEIRKKDWKGNSYKTPNKIIHHDAAIGSGSSGGPLFDFVGNLVGINTWILSPDGTSGGFGVAISADHIKDVLKD